MICVEDASVNCVLLADGNVSQRQVLSDILCLYFPLIYVEVAGDAIEAISKVEYLRPNIVFIDIESLDENVLELIKELKQIYAKIVIVILASNNLPHHNQQLIRNCADFYISKEEEFYIENILTRAEEAMSGR